MASRFSPHSGPLYQIIFRILNSSKYFTRFKSWYCAVQSARWTCDGIARIRTSKLTRLDLRISVEFYLLMSLTVEIFLFDKGNKNQRLEVITDIYWASNQSLSCAVFTLSRAHKYLHLNIFFWNGRQERRLFYYGLNWRDITPLIIHNMVRQISSKPIIISL